jgi:hypothetical protein
MNPNGTPKKRTREDMLIGVYRLVHSRMVVLETKSVRKACQDILSYLPTNDDFINFHVRKVTKGLEWDSNFDTIKNWENLRKRYYDAKKAAKDTITYPQLSQMVERLDAMLATLIEQHKDERAFMEKAIKEGRSLLYFNNEKEKQEYLGKFIGERKKRNRNKT